MFSMDQSQDHNPDQEPTNWRLRARNLVRRFAAELQLYRRLSTDPETPVLARAALWLAVGYLLLPFDLIPDVIPVLGQLDDLIIVPALVWLALRLTPDELIQRQRARTLTDETQPRS